MLDSAAGIIGKRTVPKSETSSIEGTSVTPPQASSDLSLYCPTQETRSLRIRERLPSRSNKIDRSRRCAQHPHFSSMHTSCAREREVTEYSQNVFGISMNVLRTVSSSGKYSLNVKRSLLEHS